MMKSRWIAAVVCVLGLLSALAAAQSGQGTLADRLPAADTLLYTYVDVGRTLEVSERSMLFIDEKVGREAIRSVQELWTTIREIGAKKEFEPMLFDRISDVRAYLVVMSPEQAASTSTEAEEAESLTPAVTPSLVLESEPEVADDLVAEFESFYRAARKEHPELQGMERRELEVEQGRLISYGRKGLTVGSRGDYTVVSYGRPGRLWDALSGPAAEPVSGVDAYARLNEELAGPPYTLIGADLGAWLTQAEQATDRALTRAEAQGSGGGGGPVGLQAARGLKGFLTRTKTIFSLDKLGWAQLGYHTELSEDRLAADQLAVLHHGRPISPALEEMLSGSGSFQPPPIEAGDRLALLSRVRVKKVYDEVLSAMTAAGSPYAMMMNMQMTQMRSRLGVDVPGLLDMLDSDSYLFVDMAAQEIETMGFEPGGGTGELERQTTTRRIMVPKVTAIWGVREPETAQKTLETLFSRVSADPAFSEYVNVRQHAGRPVYCVGQVEAYPEPNGLRSFALGLAGRYLALGNWNEVTGLMDRVAAGKGGAGSEVRAAVEQHPDANLLMVVPQAFNQNMQKVARQVQGQQPDPMVIWGAMIEGLDIDLGEPELEARLKGSLRRVVEAFTGYSRAAMESAASASVVSGAHRDDFYELRARSEMTR
ncbi:MAG: hypothetical protein ACOC7T_03130 [Planctomycetota bacterium]